MIVRMICAQCLKDVTLEDRRDLRVAFCSPEHLKEWQNEKTEDEIRNMFGGRCQWCLCTLHGGYHSQECPVRDIKSQ